VKRASAATTRFTSSVPPEWTRNLLVRGQLVASSESALSYRVDRLLGEGGFGQVYLAKRLGRSSSVPATVCIKVSTNIDGWLREAYVGQILEDHPRAIRVFDRFPLMRLDGRVVYCLTLEYARYGDLSAFLSQSGKGWPEGTARREIAGILEVLGQLHRGQTLHRDLTPLNVFVCDRRHLKLGDFGIVRQQNDRRGVTARTMNALTAPSDILARIVPKWQARDDVYQVGQLLGMLIKGDAGTRIRTHDVRRLPCTDDLKEIVYRCIGERRKRYESAQEMIEALAAAAAEGRRDSTTQGCPPCLHRHPDQAQEGSDSGGKACGRNHPRNAFGANDGRGAREAQSTSSRWTERRAEADGDQAAAPEGPPHHAAQRRTVLAAGRQELIVRSGREVFWGTDRDEEVRSRA
jgi:serine/threonine-protein kinase